MGLFTIFGSGLSALSAYSGAMSVIANNVANASNENYSRQRVVFEALPPDVIGGIETGRGIEITEIEQVVNATLEKRMKPPPTFTKLATSGVNNKEARTKMLNPNAYVEILP